MRKGLIYSIFLFIGLLLLSGTFSSAGSSAQENSLEGYEAAADNMYFTLFYKTDKLSIALLDKTNDKIWYSQLPESQYDPDNITGSLRDEFNSMIIITYTLLNKKTSNQNTMPLESFDYTADAKIIPDGISYNIRIKDINLSLGLLVKLCDDGIEVSVPDDEIIEGAGTKELLARKIEGVGKFLDNTREQAEAMKKDEAIPSSIKKELRKGIDGIKALKKEIDNLDDVVGIEAVSDNLIEKLNDIEKSFIGSASKPGFFTKIQLSSEIDKDVKARYSKYQKDFNDAIMPVKITISSMKTINAGGLVELQVLPYFGACGDNNEGYMLYPDGSGAITEFKQKHGVFSSYYKASVYSDQTPDIDWEKSIDNAGLKRAAMPYFGVKQDNGAFIAYITSGQSESSIIFSPSGYVVDINRISSSFIYRRSIAAQNEGGTWLGRDPYTFETNINRLNSSVKYMFLQNDQANYSNMANKLREYMDENGLIAKNPVLSEGVPLALDLLGGYNQKVLIFNNYITATTFNQASDMVKEILGDNRIPLFINFRGWQKSGYGVAPPSDKVALRLGGMNSLQKLSKLIKDCGGFLFLQHNPVEVQLASGGYHEGDLAIGTNLRVIQSSAKDSFLLSPSKASDIFKKDVIPFVQRTDTNGMTMERIGTFMYYDYNSKNRSTRSQTILSWQEILKQAKNQLGAVAVLGGNEYVLPYADWIMNAPEGVSGYIYTDYSVPFYQMVLHGYVPYTSGAFNQFYDKELELLRAIEYGSIPYYTLTYNEINTTQTDIYTSRYQTYYDEIIDTYNLYSKNLSGIMDRQIINHERTGDVVTVTYSNNARIIINYGSEEIIQDGLTVMPMSFHITKPEGGAILEKTYEAVPQGESGGVHLYHTLGYWVLFILFVPAALFVGISIFNHTRSGKI